MDLEEMLHLTSRVIWTSSQNSVATKSQHEFRKSSKRWGCGCKVCIFDDMDNFSHAYSSRASLDLDVDGDGLASIGYRKLGSLKKLGPACQCANPTFRAGRGSPLARVSSMRSMPPKSSSPTSSIL